MAGNLQRQKGLWKEKIKLVRHTTDKKTKSLVLTDCEIVIHN